MKRLHGPLIAFLSFWIFSLLFKFGAGLHYTLISPIGERLMPLWAAGLVMSIGSLLQLVLDIPTGAFLDRFGYRRGLIWGTVAAVLAGAVFFFDLTVTSFILSAFLMTIGWLFFGPGRNAYILSHATKKESERFMGYRDASAALGVVAAACLLPYIVHKSYIFLASVLSLSLVIAFVCIYLSPRDRRKLKLHHHPHEDTHVQRKHVWQNWMRAMRSLNPASTMLILINSTGAVFYGVIWFVVPLVIAHLPESSQLMGIGLGMFDFAVVVTGAFLCSIVERTEKKLMVLLGLLTFSIAGMFVGFTYGWLFLIFAFLTTTGDELANLPLWAWMHHLDKNHNKDGLISGIINVFEDLGWTVGPIVGSLLYIWVGPKLAIALGALPLLIVLIVYQFAVRKHTIKISLLEAPKKPHRQRHKL